MLVAFPASSVLVQIFFIATRKYYCCSPWRILPFRQPWIHKKTSPNATFRMQRKSHRYCIEGAWLYRVALVADEPRGKGNPQPRCQVPLSSPPKYGGACHQDHVVWSTHWRLACVGHSCDQFSNDRDRKNMYIFFLLVSEIRFIFSIDQSGKVHRCVGHWLGCFHDIFVFIQDSS